MILVDTSVWIDHLREGVPDLGECLTLNRVLAHPFVIGELACGNLGNRSEILDLLRDLPRVPVATDEEALLFIDRHSLMGRGIGYTDIHLLAAVSLEGTARIWTRDKRLLQVAGELDLAYGPASGGA